MQQGAPASPAWQLLHELAAAGEGGDTLDAAQLGILVDLCASTLRQGEEWGFSDEKLSVLLGLVKETHAASVRGRLTLEASFRFFRDSLLNHSVQRPPFSIGVFAQHETRAVLQWFISSYYRHYKLYQYAFTDRVTLDVSTRHPWELVEAPPCPPPLAEAITNEQHEEELERQRQE
ncbi:hypothetical protein MNEG_12403, partial [Monoraphidium neglectum]